MMGMQITIRTPGNLKGVEHLRREDRLLVDFFDNTVFSDRDRCGHLYPALLSSLGGSLA